jgi:uncharacterized protein
MKNTKHNTAKLLSAALLSFGLQAAYAQGTAPPQAQGVIPKPTIPVPAASAPAPISEEKKALAERIVKAQQGLELERMSTGLAQQSVGQVVQEASQVLERQIPAANKDATRKQLTDALEAYVKDVSATIKTKAPASLNSALVPIYAEKFTSDELKQLATFFESEASKKYQLTTPELGQAMFRAIVKDTEAQVNPKMSAFAKKMEDILVKNGAKKAEQPAGNGNTNGKNGPPAGSSPKNPLKPPATTPEGAPVPRPGASK